MDRTTRLFLRFVADVLFACLCIVSSVFLFVVLYTVFDGLINY